MHRRPLGRGRTLAAIAGVLHRRRLLPAVVAARRRRRPARRSGQRASRAAGILVFLAAVATLALVALPYAVGRPADGDRPLAVVRDASRSSAGSASAGGSIDLLAHGAFHFTEPAQVFTNGPGLWIAGHRAGDRRAGGLPDDPGARSIAEGRSTETRIARRRRDRTRPRDRVALRQRRDPQVDTEPASARAEQVAAGEPRRGRVEPLAGRAGRGVQGESGALERRLETDRVDLYERPGRLGLPQVDDRRVRRPVRAEQWRAIPEGRHVGGDDRQEGIRGSAGSAATTGSIAHQIATVSGPALRRQDAPAGRGTGSSSAITSAAERGGPLGSTRALATGAGGSGGSRPAPGVDASPVRPRLDDKDRDQARRRRPSHCERGCATDLDEHREQPAVGDLGVGPFVRPVSSAVHLRLGSAPTAIARRRRQAPR